MFLTVWASVVVGGAGRAARASVAAARATGSNALAAGEATAAHQADLGDSVSVSGGARHASVDGLLHWLHAAQGSHAGEDDPGECDTPSDARAHG